MLINLVNNNRAMGVLVTFRSVFNLVQKRTPDSDVKYDINQSLIAVRQQFGTDKPPVRQLKLDLSSHRADYDVVNDIAAVFT